MSNERARKVYNIGWIIPSTGSTAATKAPLDVRDIISRKNNVSTIIFPTFSLSGLIGSIVGRLCRFFALITVVIRIPTSSILFVQFPGLFLYGPLGKLFVCVLRKLKRVRFIMLVHDINCLRYGESEGMRLGDFLYVLNKAQAIIVHNDMMAEMIAKAGIASKKLVPLGIFDYLTDVPLSDKVFRKAITIAGNLEKEKAAYLSQLYTIKDVEWNLYGPNYDSSQISGQNIKYHGSFAAEQLPAMMTSGFGLVWDGNSIDTCSGSYGEYLKINNPHKLSFYLASGLPVIVWDESAESDFVRKNGVGLCVKSLYDAEAQIKAMTSARYFEYAARANEVARRLRAGYYTSSALDRSIDIANKSDMLS